MYLDHVKKRHRRLRHLGYRKPTPCTIEDVAALEASIGRRLPEAYRKFLFWMGRSGGGFLVGSDCFYSDLKDIQLWAKNLLEEDQFLGALPEDAFVFFMHQGYQFNFFSLNEGDDPPVYLYLEAIPVQTTFSLIYPTFSAFLLTETEGHIKLKEQQVRRNTVTSLVLSERASNISRRQPE